MMFLDCPAWLDPDGAVRCGLPAEVRCRFTMRSSDGPLESAMIRCPAGHYHSGPIESLTWDSTDKHDPNTAPAYYLGRAARLWITATRPRPRRPESHPMQAVTDRGERTPPRHGRQPVTGIVRAFENALLGEPFGERAAT